MVKSKKNDTEPADHEFKNFVSKSAKKRTMSGIQDIAAQLADLSQGNFDALPLDEDLRREVEATRRVKAHSARARQVRFLAQYISNMDYSEVEAALASMNHKKKVVTDRFHEAEMLRDELVAGDEDAVSKIVARFPNADRQQLRTLQRNAQKVKIALGAPKAARAIFRYLKELSDDEAKNESSNDDPNAEDADSTED